MDIGELQRKVIVFRDVRDWAQFERQRSAAFVRNFGVLRRTDDRGQTTEG